MITIGVPIKFLHEAKDMIVSVELNTGQLYRGKLSEIEDNMNLQMKEVIMTAKNGQTTAMEYVFIRGSTVKFIVLPDNLRHAPVLKNFGQEKKGKGLGMGAGRADITREAAARGGRTKRT